MNTLEQSYRTAYRMRPLSIGNNPVSVLLRSIAAGKTVVVGLIGLSAAIVKATYGSRKVGNTGLTGNDAGILLAAGAGLAGVPAAMMIRWETELAKLFDIRALLSRRDLDAVKMIINRTRKIKNLLEPYDSWDEVPGDLKDTIAKYFDDYYRNMRDLQHAINMAELRIHQEKQNA